MLSSLTSDCTSCTKSPVVVSSTRPTDEDVPGDDTATVISRQHRAGSIIAVVHGGSIPATGHAVRLVQVERQGRDNGAEATTSVTTTVGHYRSTRGPTDRVRCNSVVAASTEKSPPKYEK